MSKINSRQKGARGERYVAAMLTRLGYPATRAARIGVRGGEDISCPSLRDCVHIEVKFNESFGLGTKALKDATIQAVDCKPLGVPDVCVIWKRNRGPVCLTYRVHDANAWPTIAGEEDIKEWLDVSYNASKRTKEGA